MPNSFHSARSVQGQSEEGHEPWEGVRARCQREWGIFQARLEEAERNDPRAGTPVPTVIPEAVGDSKRGVLEQQAAVAQVCQGLEVGFGRLVNL